MRVSPTNSHVRLGVSPAAASTPTGVFSQRFEALFPHAGALGCVVCFSTQLFLLVYLHSHVGLPPPLAAALPWVLSAQLPISAPPTSLDGCVFFNSLVVRLPYSLIFYQFWSFFDFKLLLYFFWLCEEAQYVYLLFHLGQKYMSLTIFCWLNLFIWE